MLAALSLLFFCSGASALIYQVLWLRLLGLTFGVTTYDASTVWASFMAGLALGSMAAGRLADGVRRPLMWFGICELLIGATALATPAARQRPFQQRRQHALKRLALQMIEQHLGHRAFAHYFS